MPETTAHRYWAFLSYSHADESAAAKLHRALEGYVLPRRVRQAHGLPRRLAPVFRDVEDLEAASGLNTRLQQALDDSRWLIVLCSPAAAASKYVNVEIEYFLQKHGAGRILCVLLRGEPPECFPAAIRALQEEPLAADFRDGRDAGLARLRLLAAMAGIGFTELRDREAQRRRRLQLAAVVTLGGVALGALGYWDLLLREQVEYYRDYLRRDGIWEGVGRVSESAARQRMQNYRFLRHGRLHPPLEVRAVSGLANCYHWSLESVLGAPLAETEGFLDSPACSVSFDYGGDGRLQRESRNNRNGAPLEALTYTGADVAQFTQEGFGASGSSTGVYYVQFSRIGGGPLRGLDHELRFFRSRDNPRPNQDGYFGFRYEYGDAGRRTRQIPLDDAGRPLGDDTLLRYDDRGQLTERLFVDSSGRPRQTAQGCYGFRYRYDEPGNPIAETCLGAGGEPRVNRLGVATVEREFSGAGNVLVTRLLDVDGKPMAGAEAQTRARYDDQGRQIERAFFDGEGRPALAYEGEHGWWARHDALGNVVEYRFFDAARKPTCIRTGVCIWRLEYDALGRDVRQTYFDTGSQPILMAHGAGVEVRYDAQGLPVERIRLGLDGKPYFAPDLGYAIFRTRRNERGQPLEHSFFDPDGNPLMLEDGYSRKQIDYDDLGNAVEERYLDTRGKLAVAGRGYAVLRRKFDRLGQVSEESYYDARRRPALSTDGIYGYRARYDVRGEELERHYIGADGSPFRSATTGNFGVRFRRNGAGDIEEEIYLDAAGAPLSGRALARVVRRFDATGRQVELAYFSGDGRPTSEPASGCATIRTEYDSTSRVTAEHCLDAGQHAHDRRDGGWATRLVTYEAGRKIGEKFLDASGRETQFSH